MAHAVPAISVFWVCALCVAEGRKKNFHAEIIISGANREKLVLPHPRCIQYDAIELVPATDHRAVSYPIFFPGIKVLIHRIQEFS